MSAETERYRKASTSLVLAWENSKEGIERKTAVSFANTFERSSNARSGASVKTESETEERR